MNESPLARAAWRTTTRYIETTAPIQLVRKKLCVVSYSYPSGQPITMYIKPPNTQMTNRYSNIRNNPSSNPKRGSGTTVVVMTSPTTVASVVPSAPPAAGMVCWVTNKVKLKVPRLPMLRLMTQVTVHWPPGGSEASGAETVCMSAAITGEPSDTVTPSHRNNTPSAAASSASNLLRKMSCSWVGTTVSVEFGCGFDEMTSFGIVDAACAVPPIGVSNNTPPSTASKGVSTARRQGTRTPRMGVHLPYPTMAVRLSHQFARSPEG